MAYIRSALAMLLVGGTVVLVLTYENQQVGSAADRPPTATPIPTRAPAAIAATGTPTEQLIQLRYAGGDADQPVPAFVSIDDYYRVYLNNDHSLAFDLVKEHRAEPLPPGTLGYLLEANPSSDKLNGTSHVRSVSSNPDFVGTWYVPKSAVRAR